MITVTSLLWIWKGEAAGRWYFITVPEEQSDEIRAQFDKFLELGLKPTHVDGHINIHVHPVIFPALCRVAREYGVPRIRLPHGEFHVNRTFPAQGQPVLFNFLLTLVFSLLRKGVLGQARGLIVPRTWGLLRSGRMTEDYVLWLLKNLPDGLTEIYFHPSSDPNSEIGDDRPTPTHQTISELRALLSPRVRVALQQGGAHLVSATP